LLAGGCSGSTNRRAQGSSDAVHHLGEQPGATRPDRPGDDRAGAVHGCGDHVGQRRLSAHQCSVTATKGTHRVKAAYSGDGAYDGSSATLTEVVTPARPG
jgi:hypothetical protein